MRSVLACLFVLLGPLPAYCQTYAASSPRPVPAFVADLDRLSNALSVAAPSELDAIAATVPLRWHVDGGERAIDVDGSWIIHELRAASTAPAAAWPRRRTSMQKRLSAMRAQAASALDASDLADVGGQVNSAATEILKGREFQTASSAWREALQNRLARLIQALFDRLGAGRLARRDAAIVLAWIMAVAAFAGLGIWLVRSLGSPAEGGPLGLSRGHERRISAREWALRAVSAARAGDFREAVRCGYTAAIKRLEEQGVWRVDGSRTPREYLRLLGRDDERRPPVQRLTEQFEEVWYGNRPVHQDDVRGVGSILEQLGCLHPADRAI